MNISKYELITEIAMLCDELENLRRLAADARAEAEIAAIGESGMSESELAVYRAGRKLVFEQHTREAWDFYYNVLDDDGNEEMSFGKFREKLTRRVPDYMSKDEFFRFFDVEFHAAYDDRKAIERDRMEAKDACE